MTQSAFARRRAASWERLEALLARAGRRGVRGIDAAEVEEIGRLYRATTSDLAFARGREYDQRLLFYLNRLTARAHAYVSRIRPRRAGAGSRAFTAKPFRKSSGGRSRRSRSASPSP